MTASAQSLAETFVKMLNEHEAEMKGRAKAHENVDEYVRDNPEAKLYGMGNASERAVSRLRKVKRELAARDADRAQIKAVEGQITEQMRRLNDAVKNARSSN